MIHRVGELTLRCLEPTDLEALYSQKNDPEIASMLGGFTTGYSTADLRDWLEYHRERKDEVLWAIVQTQSDSCLGHVGLYQIDHRVRMAEFAIMIGNSSNWGKGTGGTCTKFVLEYGFSELNLNRIYLSVLATNERAVKVYRSLGFRDEGRLRQAQYKKGGYIDVLMMSVLREEYSFAGSL